MNVLRQETDYALRLMAVMADSEGSKSFSTRTLAEKSDVSYEFACKILQKLHEAGLIHSVMGPKGGYRLSKDSKEITLLEIVAAVQGPISVSDCLLGTGECSRKEKCPLSGKMQQLQQQMEGFLGGITLYETLNERTSI